jgi:hypothetical protein
MTDHPDAQPPQAWFDALDRAEAELASGLIRI